MHLIIDIAGILFIALIILIALARLGVHLIGVSIDGYSKRMKSVCEEQFKKK